MCTNVVTSKKFATASTKARYATYSVVLVYSILICAWGIMNAVWNGNAGAKLSMPRLKLFVKSSTHCANSWNGKRRSSFLRVSLRMDVCTVSRGLELLPNTPVS